MRGWNGVPTLIAAAAPTPGGLGALEAALVEGRQGAAYKPGRLVGLGITAAVLTVLVGAFIFAADFSVPAGYQTALARHLAKTQAIFYGAYW